MRIGLFDSGIGGLTVLKTLIDKYPQNEYIYYGDTLNLPYGNKSKEELLELAKNNINFLINKKVDMIIIACGTVSSNCLTELKKLYNIPIYDIITPVIDYLNNNSYQNIGVIATNATIKSHIFKKKVKHNVYEIATPKLVPLIEENKLKNIDQVLHNYLDPYRDKLDVLVLGCTHYPIIKNRIENILSKKVKIIDMSELLKINNGNISNIEIYFTLLNDTIIKNIKMILETDNYSLDTNL